MDASFSWPSLRAKEGNMKRKTGWYCWRGAEKTWHRTYDAAARRCATHQSQGYSAQVDCVKHGEAECANCIDAE